MRTLSRTTWSTVMVLVGLLVAPGLVVSAPAADVCGDAVVTGAEQCDDGNLADGDGCQATCRWPLGSVGDLFSDDFNACDLDEHWEVVNPLGVGTAEIRGAGSGAAQLVLSLPGGVAHDAWALAGNQALRAMQKLSVDPGDLEVQAGFESEPTGDYADQGLLVEQDARTFLRFDVYHTGTKLYAFGGRAVDGSYLVAFTTAIPAGTGHHLRVTRDGDLWTLWLSADGTQWTRGGGLTQALTVQQLGVFVANPVRAAEYAASVDFVFNVADPVEPEDGEAVDCGCIDLDGDGYGEGDSCLGTDCDDNDPEVHPLSTDTCDGQDNDCNGIVDDDTDLDGDGFSSCQGDCDDGDPAVFAANPEICDGVDNDCDGFIDDGLTSLTVLVERQDLTATSRYRAPYAGVRVALYDRAAGSCARETCGTSAQDYACIVEMCVPATLIGSGAPAEATTDAGGAVSFDVAPGKYVAVVGAGRSPHDGSTIGELECGDHAVQRLRAVATPRRIPGEEVTRVSPGRR